MFVVLSSHTNEGPTEKMSHANLLLSRVCDFILVLCKLNISVMLELFFNETVCSYFLFLIFNRYLCLLRWYCDRLDTLGWPWKTIYRQKKMSQWMNSAIWSDVGYKGELKFLRLFIIYRWLKLLMATVRDDSLHTFRSSSKLSPPLWKNKWALGRRDIPRRD